MPIGSIGWVFMRNWQETFFRTETNAQGNFEIASEGSLEAEPPWIIFARAREGELVGVAFVHGSRKPVEIRLAQGAYAVAQVVQSKVD